MENNKKISLSKISRVGLLENFKKEIIKEKIIKNITITEEEKETIKRNWFTFNSIKTDKQLAKWKEENLQSDDEWELFIARDLKWQKWCINKFQKQIKNYFLKKKPFLDKYTYSIIRVKSEGISNEIYLRIKENEADFYSIARDFSEGIEKRTGGLVGPTQLINPHPIIANILKESKDKQLWPPKKINNWWVIIRLEEKIMATLDQDLRIKLSKELGEIYLKNELKFFNQNFLD